MGKAIDNDLSCQTLSCAISHFELVGCTVLNHVEISHNALEYSVWSQVQVGKPFSYPCECECEAHTWGCQLWPFRLWLITTPGWQENLLWWENERLLAVFVLNNYRVTHFDSRRGKLGRKLMHKAYKNNVAYFWMKAFILSLVRTFAVCVRFGTIFLNIFNDSLCVTKIESCAEALYWSMPVYRWWSKKKKDCNCVTKSKSLLCLWQWCHQFSPYL